MTQYVALLRGINVGRAKRIAMADLRAWLADLGYTDARTLLQSGNAVFQAPTGAEADVAVAVHDKILAASGHDVPVVIRTARELRAIAAQDPLGLAGEDGARALVAFLSGELPAGVLDLDAAALAPERAAVRGREIYLWCPDGVNASPLVKALNDPRVGVTVTMRNRNTVAKLADLADSASH